ncbi:MAG: Spy/CpxP family protein refolding chaperone [Nitrospirae bacterium]|nr:Spy/CpxP family protein refolding chaperone [Nitrospirota bacterium]MCL5285542.1 Spy/CpxP family protein refolding chaperone [Nitrospirota bacterium]
MIKKTSLALSLMAAVLFLSSPAPSRADNLPPLTSAKTAKKFDEFRKKAGADFLLPQVFKNHPGVTFILSHAKDLSLTDKQVKRLKVIRRRMLDRSLAQMKKIESMRAAYLKMAGTAHPSPSRIHKDLHAIASLMAQATADHLAGHLSAAKVLTKAQQSRLSTLK